MQRYVTLSTILLGFIDGREQVDAFLDPGEVLEFDGSTIWLVRGEDRIESITSASLIPIMLERGAIGGINE
jgi:hypothetical protein